MSFSSVFSLLVALAAVGSEAVTGPCDIYSSGGTPCVAAHGTTRALYGAYSGALYQIQRGSDSTTTDIYPLSSGGIANASAQDTFCSGTTCVITIIYDQSGKSNHLTQAPPGGAASGPEAGGFDNLASAIGAPVTVGGKKAYGIFVSPGTGYRNDQTHSIATGDEPEGMYAILDGTHYNDGCCFDYGNAETSNTDTGNGHMEAIYHGTNTIWGTGAGNGPWVMADLENGLFSGYSTKQNTNDPTITDRFLTAVVKGTHNLWAIRAANAASADSLSTFYSGQRPNASGYNPMSKEGAIILGIGGDNSISGQGTFYEGAMTSGYPSDATENSVQANIKAAGYAVTSLVSGPGLTTGSSISFRATTPGYNTRYISQNSTNSNIITQVVTSSSSAAVKKAASFTVRTGLGFSGCYSFESNQSPGSYIRHYNFDLVVNAGDGSKQFNEDATFCPQAGLNGQGNSIRSWSYPTRFFRHYNNVGYLSSNGGPRNADSKTSFNNDVSFVVGKGFA